MRLGEPATSPNPLRVLSFVLGREEYEKYVGETMRIQKIYAALSKQLEEHGHFH